MSPVAAEPAVNLLERTVCPRIAEDAVRLISGGGSVTFGSPPAARADADAEGLLKRQPFAKKIPWNAIVRSDLALGQAQVWTNDSSGTAKVKLSIDMGGWNAVVLPRVAAMLSNR